MASTIAVVVQRQWRPILVRGSRRFSSVTTSHRMDSAPAGATHYNKYAITGHYAPVYVVSGMVSVALFLGVHTMKQQLRHSPSVSITKQRRKTILDVDSPDTLVANADHFINKSWLRKVAHIQDHESRLIIKDPTHPDPYVKGRDAKTLKTAGVNPRAK